LPLDKARIDRTKLPDYFYTVAARSAVGVPEPDEYQKIKESLAEIYKTGYFPSTSAERLGLEKGDVPQLDTIPAWVRYYPWEPLSIEDKYKATHDWSYKYETGPTRKHYGNNPSEEEKFEDDCMRLYSLYKSIQTKGYINDHPLSTPIASQLLINDDLDYRWVITGGFHRSAVCQALGYHEIESRVQNIIYRSDAGNWPGVKSTVFSKKTALKVFDLIFK
ncbi:MAG: hypothetical protein LC662_05495, partial [Rhodothermaceae bacterium]|nr:hypothetical protein [Rhodothermaceae bacterium]